MNISPTQVDLRPLHTFALQAKAERIESFEEAEELKMLLRETPPPHLILGSGSNVAFIGDFPGTVLLNRIMGKSFEGHENEDEVKVIARAGEEWHGLVRWTLENKLHGLENLSLIPGKVGAAPIQNIGAYGVELAQFFLRCQALDRKKNQIIWMDRKACSFGYRDSIFKHHQDRYVVLEVHLKLKRSFCPQLGYGDLANRAKKLGSDLNGLTLSDLVSEIRKEKLPDPCDLGNAGSFFKNPIIDAKLKTHLQTFHPCPPLYEAGDGNFKTSAAWLIDQCGLKGACEGPIEVHRQQPLVLINRGEGQGSQLCDLARRIQKIVMERFGVSLEREVRLVPLPEAG